MTHWHVDTGLLDGTIETCGDVFDALNVVSEALEDLVDYEHQGISACGDAGDFESAYRCFQRYERYDVLARNARHMWGQSRLPWAERAPLFHGGDDKLIESAHWHVSNIESDGPEWLSVAECPYSDDACYVNNLEEEGE